MVYSRNLATCFSVPFALKRANTMYSGIMDKDKSDIDHPSPTPQAGYLYMLYVTLEKLTNTKTETI